jgi:hypothetical protein
MPSTEVLTVHKYCMIKNSVDSSQIREELDILTVFYFFNKGWYTSSSCITADIKDEVHNGPKAKCHDKLDLH